jgi:YgiT-type zinc finger domain-containing protein
MKQGTAPFHVDRKGYHLLLDTVPAWVCSQCGEVLFEEGEVEAIQGAIESLDRSAEKIAAAG